MAEEIQTAEKQHISKHDLNQLWWRYTWNWFTSSSYERLQTHAFAWSYIPFVKKYYADDPEGGRRLLMRHSVFYNSEPQVGMVINGIVASLEEDIAFGGDTPEELPGLVKTTLMGPLAGIGDSLIQGIIVPTLLSIGMSISANGSPIGAIFYIITWLCIGVGGSYGLFRYGYKMGLGALDLFVGDEARRLMDSVNLLGIIVVGTLAYNYVSVSTTVQIPMGDEYTALQDTLDSMFPGLLALITTLISWWMLSKKQYSATKVLIILCIASIVLTCIGFL